MARIGFIGLGNMGLPMAQNLLKAGHAVAGFDLNVDASERLTASGGTRSNSVAEACKDAEVVITMLPAGEHVRDVYLGDGGVLAPCRAGDAPHRFLDHRRGNHPRGGAGRRGQGTSHGRCAGVRRRGRRARRRR